MAECRILCIGDVVGNAGRKVLARHLRKLQGTCQADVTIVNIENAAGGFGITESVYAEFERLPIDCYTGGNHIFDKRESIPVFDTFSKLVRPVNFQVQAPGQGYRVFKAGAFTIGVVNAIGQVFMAPVNNPFDSIDDCLSEIRKFTPIIVVDFHGEATSEKQAMGWHLDGRVSCVYGTHTHVLTNDERVLPEGTAYITDIGMTGSQNAILGMNRAPILTRFLTQMPARFEPSEERPWMINGILVTVEPDSGRALAIRSVRDYYEH